MQLSISIKKQCNVDIISTDDIESSKQRKLKYCYDQANTSYLPWISCFRIIRHTRVWMQIRRRIVVSKLLSCNEMDSHWVSHTCGIVPD